MNLQDQQRMVDLICHHRWAALATCTANQPESSWVAYALEPDSGKFLLHLSTLALHTRNLLENPFASLAISEADHGHDDPQTLARVTIQGEVTVIAREDTAYADAAYRYQQRLPDSVPRFEFGDFLLLRLMPIQARFVGGFARASRLNAAKLQAILNAPVD